LDTKVQIFVTFLVSTLCSGSMLPLDYAWDFLLALHLLYC